MELDKLLEQLTKLETTISGLLETTPKNSPSIVEPFQPREDFDLVTEIPITSAEDPATPGFVLQYLGQFFMAGFLLQRRAWHGVNQWCLTESIVGGQHQVWPPEKQLDLSRLVIQLSPDEVRRTRAIQFLPLIPSELHVPTQDTEAYLLMPAPETAYIWFSKTPRLWSETEIRHALKLTNEAFTP